jgi:hypothetical protein
MVAFRAGQTFLFPLNDENQREHLWIIVTEPNNEALFAIASFTSLKGAKDQTVILQRAEHPFLRWDTCISYAQAEIMSIEKLQAHFQYGRAEMHRDASPAVLKLVLEGFSASDFTKNRVLAFVNTYRAALTKKC